MISNETMETKARSLPCLNSANDTLLLKMRPKESMRITSFQNLFFLKLPVIIVTTSASYEIHNARYVYMSAPTKACSCILSVVTVMSGRMLPSTVKSLEQFS
jgi:hypothetical protein